VSSVGAAVVCAAIQMRGPEEEGHNLLMLLGTLLVVGGVRWWSWAPNLGGRC
jgi:hypothetical protein